MPVLAHVPSFPKENTSPERAVVLADGAKSWAFYDRLDGDEVKYYRVQVAADERLQVGTFTPRRDGFTPSLVVMSPAFNGSQDASSEVPAGVTVPDGMGTVVVEGKRAEEADYEPFAPMASYRTTSYTREVDSETTFLVAIYDPENRSGPVGLSLGYEEEFSTVEYLRVPFDVIRTHLWEGQHPLVVFGPWLATLSVGMFAIRTRLHRSSRYTGGRFVLAIGGVLLLASAVTTAVQIGLALAETGWTGGALLTAAFVVVPLLGGAWVVRVTLRGEPIQSIATRVGLVAAGLLALATWAGFLVGPAILVLASMLPAQVFRRK